MTARISRSGPFPAASQKGRSGEQLPLCEQCGEVDATTAEWGPWLCDACATATAQGDGGMTGEDSA